MTSVANVDSKVWQGVLGGVVGGVAVGAAAATWLSRRPYQVPKVWTNVSSGGKWAGINRPTAGAQNDIALKVGEHPLQLYSLGTPNGVKVTILLEELYALKSVEYDAWFVNIGKGDQFSKGFVAANPNSKIPALVDHSTATPTRVFESGHILQYLADKHNAFIPTDTAGRVECLNWLYWLQGSAPVKIEYCLNRFTMELKRQLDVLDQHLADKKFMCGDEYTIADMAIWPWYGRVITGDVYGAKAPVYIDAEKYQNVLAWGRRIAARPAVKKGILVNKMDQTGVTERHSNADFDNHKSKM